MIAPTSPAKMIGTVSVHRQKATGDRLCDLGGKAGAEEIEHGGKDYRGTSSERPRGDWPCHSVGAVVEPVGVVKDEGYGDNFLPHLIRYKSQE